MSRKETQKLQETNETAAGVVQSFVLAVKHVNLASHKIHREKFHSSPNPLFTLFIALFVRTTILSALSDLFSACRKVPSYLFAHFPFPLLLQEKRLSEAPNSIVAGKLKWSYDRSVQGSEATVFLYHGFNFYSLGGGGEQNLPQEIYIITFGKSLIIYSIINCNVPVKV